MVLCCYANTLSPLYEIYFTTTQINPVFYIYTLERSFCLIINIMINIRYISRCVIQISKSVRFILHALSSDYRFSSVCVKNSPPTALREDASVSRLTCMRCHDNAQSDTPQSNTECRTDITIRARTVYTANATHVPAGTCLDRDFCCKICTASVPIKA